MQRSRRVMLITFALTVLLSLSAVLPVLAAPVAQVGIEDVGADTPAESAGLQDGDVILAVNGTYISGVDQLAGAILAAEPGDELTLNVLRGTEFLELTATLGERDGRAFLGIVPAQPDGDAPAPVPTEEETEEPAATPEAEEEEEPEPEATAEPAEEAEPEATPAAPEEAPDVVGALIGEVVPDSPADRAGIQAGDVITAVEDEPVNADNDLGALIGQYSPGDEVGITFADPATGDEMTIVVTLGENPSDPTRPFLGVRYMIPGAEMDVLPVAPEATPEAEEEAAPAATPEAEEEAEPEATPEAQEEAEPEATPDADAEVLPVPTDVTGALIGAVLTGGPADEAGIRPGDVVTAVEGEAVDAENDLAALVGQYAPGDEVGVTIFDPESGEEVTIVVVLGENPNDATVPFLGVRYIMIEAEDAIAGGDGGPDAEVEGAETPAAEEETDAIDNSGRRTPVRPPRTAPATPEQEGAAPEATPAPAEASEPEPAAEEATPEAEEDAEATPEPAEEGADADEAPEQLPEDAEGFGLLSGAVVGRVVEDGPAAAAGVRTGDVIVAIDGVAVDAENDLASLISAYAPGDEVEITLVDWRNGDEFSVVVTLGENPDVAGAPFLGVSYMPLDMQNMMPRHRGGRDGNDQGSDDGASPFFRHHGMDMDDFMERLGCDAENEEERPPFCHMFDDLPQGEGQ
jgi:S1-C subfamily serine protease